MITDKDEVLKLIADGFRNGTDLLLDTEFLIEHDIDSNDCRDLLNDIANSIEMY